MKRISSFIYSKISFRLNIHSSSSDLNMEQWLKQIVYYIKQVLEPYSSFFPAIFGKTKSRCST